MHSSFNVDLLSPYKPNVSEFAGRPIPKASPAILESDTGENYTLWKGCFVVVSAAAK